MTDEQKSNALDVSLDANALKGAIREAVTKGLADGVSSWEIQNEITEQAGAALKDAKLAELVGESLRELLDTELAGLAGEIAQSIVSSLKIATHEVSLTIASQMLWGVRANNQDRYMSDDDRKRLLRETRREVLDHLRPDDTTA